MEFHIFAGIFFLFFFEFFGSLGKSFIYEEYGVYESERQRERKREVEKHEKDINFFMG